MVAKSNLLLLAVLVAGAVALASGCSSVPTIEVPKEVKVEIPVACLRPQDVPARPAQRSPADLMAMDRYRRTLAAWSDLTSLRGYAAELEALVAGCSRIPPPP